MFEKADVEERIWRWGQKSEHLDDMQQLCSEAYEVIGLYGVTAFCSAITGVKISYAAVRDLRENGFEVYVTPLQFTPQHRTVTFSRPIDLEMINLWNRLWKRK